MQFVLKIDVDNDAFAQDLAGEVARALLATAARIKREGVSYDERVVVRDANGNKVGHAEFRDRAASEPPVRRAPRRDDSVEDAEPRDPYSRKPFRR